MHRRSIALIHVLVVLILLLSACSLQDAAGDRGPVATAVAEVVTQVADTSGQTGPVATLASAFVTPTPTLAGSIRSTGTPGNDPAVEGEPPIQVFFTSSQGEAGENGPVEEAVLSDLNAAQKSIDIAMYNFSLRRVADALIAVKARGVQVRMVTDSDALDGSQFARLEKGGVPVIGDRREGLMHDKFVVIDRAVVWTGSLNLTGSGTYEDNNNFARFASPELADNYTTEFEEMFVQDKFGSDSPANTPHPKLQVGGVSVENYFAPEDKASPKIVTLVRGAKKSIHFLAYSFTSDPISKAMLDRSAGGVEVRGVFDASQYESNTGTEYLRLKRGVKGVRLDGNPGLMHHKVIIIDGSMVIFGSYNFTASADRTNDENVVVVRSPQIAGQYEQEFERVYAQGQK